MSSSINRLFGVAKKTVLITGGSRGIGKMLATGYVNAGARVIISSRSEDALLETVESIKSTTENPNPELFHIASNVASREGCEQLAEDVKEFLPDNRLDVLLNNAGNAWGEPLDRTSGKMNWGWDRVLDLNLKGVFYLTRACLPYMKRESLAEDPSRIINIGSVVGMIPQSAPTHAYDVSKAGVHHLTKKLSHDLAPHNITVNALAPGFVPSKMSEGLSAYASFEEIAKNTPMGRLGDEDDMVGCAIYLSSRASSWVTGVVVNVDGGAVGGMQIPLASDDLE
ncbi:hypothetical protein TrVE_jg6300 [Triparma verrucosa]|uniref:3-oxoacyl-ACP reductase n=1 Tax=Triparma verrucosa TaxID=1606542 RepID=A0A9W7F164_9STRA|nr:hypothetical protein TrVE_jg6300 [Triparma verrucosa]|mmetsp:Transcript_12143/g.22071  ORF Transcript_12143/g.22071 Transcript_12143/m.22071 type:complete len:282 (+) Transcript_12143:206-1051(+)